MSAAAAIRAARDAGVDIATDGNDLLLEASTPPPAELVDLVSRHKAEIIAFLSTDVGRDHDRVEDGDRGYWHRRYTDRILEWLNGKREWAAAQRIAWGDLQNEWHKLYGRRWPAWQCAGCQKPIGGLAAIDMVDGNRVHFGSIECLLSFGRHWRDTASAALIAFGLTPPDTYDRDRSAGHCIGLRSKWNEAENAKWNSGKDTACAYCGRPDLPGDRLLDAAVDGHMFRAHRACLDQEFESWRGQG